MKVLMVLNKSQKSNVRVVVHVEQPLIRSRVRELLQEERRLDAFEMVKQHGSVEMFLPAGGKLPFTPDLTFIEDLL